MTTVTQEDMYTLQAAILPKTSEEANNILHGKGKRKPGTDISPSTAIYDGVAMIYNQADKGALVLVNLPNRPTMGNLHRVLKCRGLVNEMDYVAYKAVRDVHGVRYPVKERPVILEKLTDAAMRLFGPSTVLPRSLAMVALKNQANVLRAQAPQPGTNVKRDRRTERANEALKGTQSPVDSVLQQATPAFLDQLAARQLAEQELPELKMQEKQEEIE